MSQKPSDVLDSLFEGIEDQPSASSIPSSAPQTEITNVSEQDILAELDYLTAERPKAPVSRPVTPRLSGSTGKKSVERARTPAGRSSGEGAYSGYGYGLPPSRRNSGDVAGKNEDKAAVPVKEATVASASGSGDSGGGGAAAGGWGWSSIWNTATTVVKSAEAAVKEIQQSEEGRKWAQQVKGNAEVLASLAGDVKSRALPTFTNLLHTIAPPISSHEQLRIHISHDLQNYPFVDTVVYGIFERVMQQVEGGDLMIVQRGGASKPRSSGEGFGGPWWKGQEKRDLNATAGKDESLKLARVTAESYAQDFMADPANAQAETADNPTRKSNIFLCIQPAYFPAITISDALEKLEEGEESEKVIAFAIHLYDPIHKLSFSALSQTLPAQWLEWLDAPTPETKSGEWPMPDVIRKIVDAGGVDPREWVVEWVEEAVGLAVGIVAQKYVAKRMRVGEIDVAVKREAEIGGGEEARAVGM
ncbi:hypothetical protein RUND412_001554 [Rhizina undulata]